MTWNVLTGEQLPPLNKEMIVRDRQGNHWITMRIAPDMYFSNMGQQQTHLHDEVIERYCVL